MNMEILERGVEIGLFPQSFIDNLKSGKCPLCSVKIDTNSFRDELSIQEFTISGMCQDCQDETFNEEGE